MVADSSSKWILSLDGGGVRGAISVAFLERIESICRDLTPNRPPLDLFERFDLVGGTSTGAVIASTLALGLPIEQIKRFYLDLAPRVFRRSRWRLAGIHTVFDAAPLREEISRVLGERTLDSADLRTHLAIVMKRMDTGSPWIMTNNPKAKFWNDASDGSYIGNRRYRLANLVRASTAAPYFFAPEEITISHHEPDGLFVDGGISPHNNPALALLEVATIPGYGFEWPTGADRLRIVSIGTGRYRPRLDLQSARRATAIGLAMRALQSVGADCNTQVLTVMQMLGRTPIPWSINAEIGDMRGISLPHDALFTFLRYDVALEREWLRDELGYTLSDREIEDLRRMDHAPSVPLAYEIGRAAAAKLVKREHFLSDPAG